ncbi:unnamed protein product, partial [Tetraodon nigroviridis]
LFPASFAIRLALVVYGDYQDRTMEVKYTDIDYHVFTDAARFISEGASPYARSTYRYTPLLAWMLLPNIYLSLVAGKMLFVACDVLSGLLLYQILRLRGLNSEAACRLCSLWLLNPLPMGVSTRGNAESMMAALVLATLLCLTAKRLWWAAFLYGLSVHMKIYPVTYALPIALTLRTPAAHTERAKRTSVVAFIGSFLTGSCSCLLVFPAACSSCSQGSSITSMVGSFSTRPIFTISPEETPDTTFLRTSTCCTSVELLLLLVASWAFYSDLAFCWFLHTAIFVSFNKVCTSQYFLWYLCLLPLVIPRLRLSGKQGVLLLLLWFAGQGASPYARSTYRYTPLLAWMLLPNIYLSLVAGKMLFVACDVLSGLLLYQILRLRGLNSEGVWLAPAYYLEFEGYNTFLIVWSAGLLFLIFNSFVLIQIISHYKP